MKAVELVSRVDGGKIEPGIAAQIGTLLRQMDGKKVGITFREVKRRRSNNQNAFYWSVTVPAVQDMFRTAGDILDGEEVHAFLKAEVGKLKRVVLGPDGVRRTVVRSSTSLDTAEWEVYQDQIRAWAAQFGVALPYPNEF